MQQQTLPLPCMWRLWIGLALLVASGCQPIQPPTPAPVVLDLAEASSNRLLVLSEEGNLFTINPDGSGRFDLTTDANPSHFYTQPTWSPTGERIAWAEVNTMPSDLSGALITSAADGTGRTRVETPFPPFYLNWSPDGNRLAYLSNWIDGNRQTIALRLVDIAAGGDEASTLGLGQPFYFSWAPNSQQLLTHVGNAEISLLALDGSTTLLADNSPNFATPQWSAAGDRLLYGVHQNETPQLILADTAGEVQQVITLLTGDAGAAFNLSPNGTYVAYTETDAEVNANSFGPLYLADLATEEFEQLTSDPVLAFFWSPSGDALLFMHVEFEGTVPWLRLQVWDGEETRPLSRFIPSPTFFRQYLPFADQYAQSMNFWAPDGSAVLFAGRVDGGGEGVWVHALDADEPELVAAGVFATWSPR